jgi:hypothetical protein
MITRQQVASKLMDYLRHRLSLTQLAEWATSAMMEEDFDESDMDLLSDIVSRIGLAGVQNFGLSWEDCEGLLFRLGYRVDLTITPS